jgi:hypothetical protein
MRKAGAMLVSAADTTRLMLRVAGNKLSDVADKALGEGRAMLPVNRGREALKQAGYPREDIAAIMHTIEAIETTAPNQTDARPFGLLAAIGASEWGELPKQMAEKPIAQRGTRPPTEDYVL